MNPGGEDSQESPKIVRDVKDQFARQILGHPEVAKAFLKEFAPELNPDGDWSRLKEEPTYLPGAEFNEKRADLLFSNNRGDQESLAYILLEHKSQQEHGATLYMTGLCVRIWDKYQSLNGAAKLPPIIPIILHQSTRRWTAPLQFREYYGERPECSDHFLWFKVRMVELATVQTETLADWTLRAVLNAMIAHVEGRPWTWLKNHIEVLSGELMNRLGLQTIQLLLTYIGAARPVKGEAINVSTARELASNISDRNVKGAMMTWIETFKEEGRVEGMMEGRQEGILIGKIVTFHEIMDLPPADVINLEKMSPQELQLALDNLREKFRRSR